jgi:hypothetical protein
MDDILSQGGDREPSRWPRRLAPLAVLVVLAVVIVMHIPHGRTTLERPPAVAATGGAVQLAGLGSGAASLLDRGGWVTGPGLPWTGTFRVVYLGQHPGLRTVTYNLVSGGGPGRRGFGYLVIRYMRVGGGSTVQLVRR